MNNQSTGMVLLATALMASTAAGADNDNKTSSQPSAMEEVFIWGSQQQQFNQKTGPVSHIVTEDLISINQTTTEDLVKFEPGLVIRKRFIGDANGTMGMRGSNMFQTTRTMVFADGVPLHYLLQTRWSGAPRWTMVSASEIAQVDVLYGPFSAALSGNAMGGAILIETAIPQSREFHVDGTFFSQSFDAYGFDDKLNGFKGFMSYGDKIGDLSVYLSYNRLNNDAHPQTFYFGGAPVDVNNGAPTPVTGAIVKPDERGQTQYYFGDQGKARNTTDNLKLKLGYDWGNWSGLLNLAYEDRTNTEDRRTNYLRDADGNPVWGGNVVQDGHVFFVTPSSFNSTDNHRKSLSAGIRLKGELSETGRLEINANRFSILKDETLSSAVNINHPDFSPAGQLIDFDDTGWTTADVQYSDQPGNNEALRYQVGARSESYELNNDVFDSNHIASGSKDKLTSTSGGKTGIQAAFVQATWAISEHWDTTLGGRYEQWKSSGGYFSGSDGIVKLPRHEKDRFSPKFSIGYQSNEPWSLRYSWAKAYRFPIIEELFSQSRSFNSIRESNPNLQPEDGTHHNLTADYALARGYVRVNLFAETIRDVIENQSTVLSGGSSLSTFIPIDEVETRGAEFIFNMQNVADTPLDIRFNTTWTDATIVRNSANTALEGNRFPRMPKWRSNLLATWHFSPRWDAGINYQYASDSFGRLDNTDHQQHVYGAQDGYSLVGLKTSLQVASTTRVSLGIDNLTDERVYVAHPWPGRTLYMSFSYDL